MELQVPSCRQSPVGVLSLCIFVLLLASGCQTQSRNFSRIVNEPAPLPAGLRASFGKVGVVPDAVMPDPRWSRPMNKLEAMEVIAERTFKNTKPSLDSPNIFEPKELLGTAFFDGFYVA